PGPLPSFPTRRSSDLVGVRQDDLVAMPHPVKRCQELRTDQRRDPFEHGLFPHPLEGVEAAPDAFEGLVSVTFLLDDVPLGPPDRDRKSTRLNSSHVKI